MEDRIRGTVVHYTARTESDDSCSHERATLAWIAGRLARLLGYKDGGEYDPGRRYAGPLYFVPAATLVGDEAAALGIRSDRDFFGGTVPHRFVATKSIAHPLFDGASAPSGWVYDLASRLGEVVLDGYTAFDLADARKAGRQVLAAVGGRARVKAGAGIGGRGQTVVSDEGGLDAALGDMDSRDLALHGVVIEQNLEDIRTYSVGQVTVRGLTASYVGEQVLTSDNAGAEVYGGSELIVARGGSNALLGMLLSDSHRMAVEHARAFDGAASEAYPDLTASRRNYDVAQGLDHHGHSRMGVLEQSWRVGGASPAEVAALEALARHPGLRAVKARCVEIYGKPVRPAPGAIVHYCGIDNRVGPLTKCVFVDELRNAP